MTLNEELDRIFLGRNREDMQPTIDALSPLHACHPENAPVLYEVGGAYDTAGQEELARNFYEKALAAGLEGDALRRCYVQYGSTLRNLGEYEKSCEIFRDARAAFPESPVLGVFEAITLHAAGRPNESIAALLDVVVNLARSPDVERCNPPGSRTSTDSCHLCRAAGRTPLSAARCASCSQRCHLPVTVATMTGIQVS
jgi:tetratricopeptide (TPR) repeat protein